MADRGSLRWEADTYSETQVAAVLRAIGVDAESETESVFLAYCPFHGNRDTPSFAVNKTDGTFICFNPSCGKAGGFQYLVQTIGRLNDFQAKRLIIKNRLANDDILSYLSQTLEPHQEWTQYDQAYLAKTKQDMWKYKEPQIYMKGRGFERQTAEDFGIGYDLNMNMICVPMHDPMGAVEVGAVRRSIVEKAFKNTPGLPTAKTLFNIHRAKKTGSAVIVVEASFDVMRLHQAGYPNAVACLGGNFSKAHALQLEKYFDTVTIMTDYDDKSKHVYKRCPKCKKEGSNLCRGHNPGEELGLKIAEMMSTKRIMWAHHGGATRFPEGAKDPGDMDDEIIRYSIKNAISHFEYAVEV